MEWACTRRRDCGSKHRCRQRPDFRGTRFASHSGDWTWSQYAATFGGQELENGNDSTNLFRPGTAFIKPVIVANEHGAADNFINWRDVSLTEVDADTTPADLIQPIVDLSIITGGDQRHALPLPQGTPYSWAAALVKVDTSQHLRSLGSVGQCVGS